jgi:hypothetical protein
VFHPNSLAYCSPCAITTHPRSPGCPRGRTTTSGWYAVLVMPTPSLVVTHTTVSVTTVLCGNDLTAEGPHPGKAAMELFPEVGHAKEACLSMVNCVNS